MRKLVTAKGRKGEGFGRLSPLIICRLAPIERARLFFHELLLLYVSSADDNIIPCITSGPLVQAGLHAFLDGHPADGGL